MISPVQPTAMRVPAGMAEDRVDGRVVVRTAACGIGRQTGGRAQDRAARVDPARRPLTRLGVAGLAAHVFFELGSGVGMPLASVIGPRRAATLWAGLSGVVLSTARSAPPRADSAFALVNGFGVAAVAAHMVAWPRRRTKLGLPWLVDCEGLGPRAMRYYNPMLYLSAAACGLALVRENRCAPIGARLLLLTLVPLIAAYQHWEHRRLKRMAAREPAWWNRRLAAQRND